MVKRVHTGSAAAPSPESVLHDLAGETVKVLVAGPAVLDGDDPLQRLCGVLGGIDRRDAPDFDAAVAFLLVWSPGLVLASSRLPGHAQGGLRIVRDALALGVPAVLVAREAGEGKDAALHYGVPYVTPCSSSAEWIAAVSRALERSRLPT